MGERQLQREQWILLLLDGFSLGDCLSMSSWPWNAGELQDSCLALLVNVAEKIFRVMLESILSSPIRARSQISKGIDYSCSR